MSTDIGNADADIQKFEAILGHVPDSEHTLRALPSILKHGLRALLLTASRNAIFARLTVLLRQQVKEKVVVTRLPKNDDGGDGSFKFHNRVPLRDIKSLTSSNDLVIKGQTLICSNSYIVVLLANYLVRRGAQGVYYFVGGDGGAKKSNYILRKSATVELIT